MKGPFTKDIGRDPGASAGAGDYVDEGELGRGAQGEVRRVVDTNLLRPLAMKILDPEDARDERTRRRFVEEAQITAQLAHPNIPPVHRLGWGNDGQLFFTMKLLPGSTLEDVLRRGAHLGDSKELFRCLTIFVTVCNAVAFAHARGVVHRDLKPENIMVAERGQVYVMDWGIAVRLSGELGHERGTISGTPGYMAPEQAGGSMDGVDPRSDVFALGAILYHLLVGRPPYEGETPMAALVKAARCEYEHPQRAARHYVPEALCRVVLRAMSRDPVARYQTVDELREDVEAFMSGPAPLPVRSFPAGAIVVREGDPAECAYVILRGRARVYKTVAGRQEPVRELGPGAAFGEAAILGAQPRTASVEALEPLLATVITREALEQELGQTGVLAPLVRQLASTFRAVDGELTARRVEATATGLARATLLYVATHGVDAGNGERAVAWTPLRDHLCRVFACEPREATLGIGSMPEARLDVPRDVLRITMNYYEV